MKLPDAMTGGLSRSDSREAEADARATQGAPDYFEWESAVRSYCRSFPMEIDTAKNAIVTTPSGREYIDFLAGAGSLNYGHNDPAIKEALVDYIRRDGIAQSLDLHTTAKRGFIQRFVEIILQPRGLAYKLQFTGPTGTNAVEAAFKIARLSTRRVSIGAFTNSFHGMSLGALAASGNRHKRSGSGLPLSNVTVFPFDGYFGAGVDTIAQIERMLEDPSSGIDMPAAFIVETVQGEGGLNVASPDWLRRLSLLAQRLGILLIVDDIQAGCGRTGTFFSFESAGIRPDLVCLSKSIGGYGVPMSLLLISAELDIWEPGQHNGTFRGNNHAFVAASAALEKWKDAVFLDRLRDNCDRVWQWLGRMQQAHAASGVVACGRGLLCGLRFDSPATALKVSEEAFARGVIAETCGARGEVLKLLPPLTTEPQTLQEGLHRIASAIESSLGGR